MSNDGPALLVVDDNDDNRYTLTRRLRRQGYENITEVENGRDALAALEAAKFDLVLLDVMMPEMNGFETLEHIKSDMATRDIPVIMISALDELESVVRCIELGAEDYLNKPFNATLLKARVGASLEKKRLRDQEAGYLDQLETEQDRSDKLLHAILPPGAVHHVGGPDGLQEDHLRRTGCDLHVEQVGIKHRRSLRVFYRQCKVIEAVGGYHGPISSSARPRSITRLVHYQNGGPTSSMMRASCSGCSDVVI